MLFRSWNKRFGELQATVDRVSKMVGGISNNLGDVTEEFFFNSLVAKPVLGGIHFDQVLSQQRMDSGKWAPSSIKVGKTMFRYTDWPGINFVIYHSAFRWTGMGNAARALAQFDATIADVIAQAEAKNDAAWWIDNRQHTSVAGRGQIITEMYKAAVAKVSK
mgnify:CR=1 FL=1